MIKIFVGWDEREIPAYHALAQTLIEKSSLPVSVSPIGNGVLPKSLWWRPRGGYDTTDFSNARFFVPFLCGYQGWAIYMDCDIVCRADIADLWALRDDRYAVMCVKHDYAPKAEHKAMGEQTRYNMKNWSSVMLFNNNLCRDLTQRYVNSAAGLDLHQFVWLPNHELIGSLPNEWNHLVEEYPFSDQAKLVHYTLGGPYMEGYEDTEYASDWFKAYKRMSGGRTWT